MSKTRTEYYAINVEKMVISLKDRQTAVWISSDIHAKLRVLSVSTRLPIQTLVQVLLEMSLPHLSKDLVAHIRKKREIYLRERYWKASGGKGKPAPLYKPKIEKNRKGQIIRDIFTPKSTESEEP